MPRFASALFIVNPAAGRVRFSRWLDRLLPELRPLAGRIEVVRTAGRCDAGVIARQAALLSSPPPLLLVGGGDGTINEVVNSILGGTIGEKGAQRTEEPIPRKAASMVLGVIPVGTGNGLAREIGLPIRSHLAARALASPEAKIIEIAPGRSGGRYFVLMAGAGIDALTALRVEQYHRRLKRWTGGLSYLLIGIRVAFSYRFPRIDYFVDGEKLSATGGIVAKAKLKIPPGLLLAPPADLQKEHLVLCYSRADSAISLFANGIRFLLRGKGIDYIEGKTIEATCAEDLPLQVDGEIAGALPAIFTVSSARLKLLAPP